MNFNKFIHLYKKEDKQMKEMTTININCSRQNEARINPYIFGHFVEDIRDHMDAMLAYPLRDMDFEHEDKKGYGVSGSWKPVTNGKNTAFALEPAAPKHTGHSQRIRIYSDDDCYAGVSQTIAIRGNISYQIKLFARASIEIKFVTIEVIDSKTQEILCKERIDIRSHDWQEYIAQINAVRDCNEAEFRILISSEEVSWRDSIATGMLWLDHISMLPIDSVGNVKKEVFEMTQDLNAGMMRIGGNYISAYHWKYGIGPEYERPVMLNEAWDVLAWKYFGTDEFLRFCEDLAVEPLICINDGSGTPEEAAQWVEYCNGSVDTPMGALRTANGHAKPYKVKYWEIGNEVWGPWQVGHCSAEEFANRYVKFAKAMREVDPEIVLLACGHDDPEWNSTVLEIAGEQLNYLTMHIYQGYNRFGFINKEVSREDKYKAIVSYPEVTRQIVQKTRDIINSDSKYSHLKLAITEHNTMYYPNTMRKGLPNEHSLEAAVANAGNLNEFIRNSDLIEIGSFSDLVNGWLGGCIRVGDNYADQFRGKVPGWSGKGNVVYGTPTYHMMKMYANRDIAYVVDSKVDGNVFSVPGDHPKFDMQNLPELDVVACVNENSDTLTVFVVNRSLSEVHTTINIEGFHFADNVNILEISGPNIDSINDVFQPENIACKRIEDESSLHEFSFKAYSVYALEFKKGI